MRDESVVEAALFSAGRPIEAKEMAQYVGMDEDKIKVHLKALAEDYSSRDSAIEVIKVGKKYVMQLKGDYADRVSMVAERNISTDLLKTAALIAYHQPILQSSLMRMVGSKTYEHVRELKGMNLIVARPKGNSLELSTSKSFPDYFGIDAANRDQVKQWFQEQVQKRE